MKKFLLIITSISLFAFTNGYAQTFTVPQDTVKAIVSNSGNTLAYNNITNASSSDINVTWQIVGSNFPAEWIPHMAFCDNHQCYGNTDNSLWDGTTGATHTTDNITAGTTALFDAQMGLDTVSVTGTYYVDVYMSVFGQTKTVRFIFTKWPLGVNNAVSNKPDIAIYPNPATNQLNVVFNPNSDIKSIGIYNVIGKMESMNRVTTNSAGINVSNLPRGVYFVSLRDSKGNVVSTRKFIKE